MSWLSNQLNHIKDSLHLDKALIRAGENILDRGLDSAGKWLKTDGANLVEGMINGLNISQGLKDEMKNVVRDITNTVGDNAVNYVPLHRAIAPTLPHATPFEQSHFSRSYDELVAELRRIQAEANVSIGEGEDKKANNGKGKKDFFIALAEALGRALQDQAIKVEGMTKKVGEMIDAKAASNSQEGSEGIMYQQTLLAAESQKLNFLATGFQSALKAVGDSLSTMGRG